jgi:Spy/CpxP family protein refolding chaperone
MNGGAFMNKRASLIVALVALMAIGVMTTSSIAQGKSGTAPSTPAVQSEGTQSSDLSRESRGRWNHGPSLKALIKKLGITDEQKTQIRSLYTGFSDRTRKTRTDLMALRDEKRTMLLSGKVDQQKLAQIDDQIVKLVSDLMRERLKLKRDRLAVLTPEQIGRLSDWKAEKAFQSKAKRMHWGRLHDRGSRGQFRG